MIAAFALPYFLPTRRCVLRTPTSLRSYRSVGGRGMCALSEREACDRQKRRWCRGLSRRQTAEHEHGCAVGSVDAVVMESGCAMAIEVAPAAAALTSL